MAVPSIRATDCTVYLDGQDITAYTSSDSWGYFVAEAITSSNTTWNVTYDGMSGASVYRDSWRQWTVITDNASGHSIHIADELMANDPHALENAYRRLEVYGDDHVTVRVERDSTGFGERWIFNGQRQVQQPQPTTFQAWDKWIQDREAREVARQEREARLAEERAEREARWAEERARREAERQAEQAEREVADAVSEELLREFITEEQQQQLDDQAAFVVQALERRYLIRKGATAYELDDEGNAVASLCIHPRQRYPWGDEMLTLKLLAETDEAEFRRIANITPIHRAGVALQQ